MKTCYVVLDLETNFAHTHIDLCGMYLCTSDVYNSANDKELTRAILSNLLREHEKVIFITWNGSRFDFPMLSKVWGINLMHPNVHHIDGMLLSKLLHHGRKGGHSLKNVAMQEFPYDKDLWKSEIDFGEASPEELDVYCKQDCKTTWMTVAKMLQSDEYRKFSPKLKHALIMEQQVAYLVQDQVEKEVFFDIGRAREIYNEIIEEMEHIESIVEPKLPEVKLKKSALHYPPKLQFKLDGTVTKNLVTYCAKYGVTIHKYPDGSGYYCMDSHREESWALPMKDPIVTTKKLTLKNQVDLKVWLLESGWVPTQYNFKFVDGKKVNTSARLTDKITKEPCPNLALIGIDYVEHISRWLMLRSRKNVLLSDRGTGWIGQASKSPTSSIPSDADSMGANTSRWTHKGIANVPRPSSPYGHIRECFAARKDKVWVGWDASALEACVEAHYTYKYDMGAYAKVIMEGDVHTKNQEALGLPDRATAKTFKYAITYGAQPSTLSKTLRSSVGHAEKIYDDFWLTNPALSALKHDLEKEWELSGKQWITGLDGRKVSTRSKHSLLNALFQSAGAIIMKRAMLLAESSIYRASELVTKENTYGLIRYHDEEIWETDEALAAMVGYCGVQSVIDAGKVYNLNVDLSAEYKVGDNWLEVH